MKCILFQLFFLLTICSCAFKSNPENKRNIEVKESEKNKEGIICELNEHAVDKIADFVIGNPKAIIASISKYPKEEECIFALIDELSNEFIKTSNKFYLEALDTLNSHSDGFLSEYFMDVSVRMFNQNFKALVLYLYTNKNSSFESTLVDGLSMELSVLNDEARKNRHDEIIAFVGRKIKQYNFSENQEDFIGKILNRLEAEKFDY